MESKLFTFAMNIISNNMQFRNRLGVQFIKKKFLNLAFLNFC